MAPPTHNNWKITLLWTIRNISFASIKSLRNIEFKFSLKSTYDDTKLMPKYQVATTHTFRDREIHTPVHNSITHVTKSSMWSVCHISMFKFTFLFGCCIHTTGHVCAFMNWRFCNIIFLTMCRMNWRAECKKAPNCHLGSFEINAKKRVFFPLYICLVFVTNIPLLVWFSVLNTSFSVVDPYWSNTKILCGVIRQDQAQLFSLQRHVCEWFLL